MAHVFAAIVGFIQKNVVVVLPFSILLIKLIVRWLTREDAREFLATLPAFPCDLVYIAMSLVLAGIARTRPGFAGHFGSDTQTDLGGLILILVLIAVAILVTYCARWVRILGQNWYSAFQYLTRLLEVDGKKAPRKVAGCVVWIIVYFALMIVALTFETVLSVSSLTTVLHLI